MLYKHPVYDCRFNFEQKGRRFRHYYRLQLQEQQKPQVQASSLLINNFSHSLPLFSMHLLYVLTTIKVCHNILIYLRLDCSYADCKPSPTFSCTFTASVEFLKANTSTNCKPVLPDHRVLYINKTTSYSCNLTRKGTTYVKNITIDYSIGKGRG